MSPVPGKRCPYCHKSIRAEAFEKHLERHTRLRDDGQMEDHVTLPPEDRESGDLEGVPRVYIHEACGATTVMPEEIVRSYLKNPFLYNDFTFCTGCGDYFHEREFEWTETGQNLHEYKLRLKQRFQRRGKKRRSAEDSQKLLIVAGVILLLGLVALLFAL